MTLTPKQIQKFCGQYAEYFPGWEICHRLGALVRVNDAVLQGILLNRSSLDAYCPTGFIRVLTAPKDPSVMELPQPVLRPPKYGSDWFVRLPLRNDPPDQHDREIKDVVRELYQQIRPRLDQPLDQHEVLRLYEEYVKETKNNSDMFSVATLNAYLGHFDRTAYWRMRYRQTITMDAPQWDIERLQFLDGIEKWIEDNIANHKLNYVIRQQRKEMGISDSYGLGVEPI